MKPREFWITKDTRVVFDHELVTEHFHMIEKSAYDSAIQLSKQLLSFAKEFDAELEVLRAELAMYKNKKDSSRPLGREE